jgi:hypothetical protein
VDTLGKVEEKIVAGIVGNAAALKFIAFAKAKSGINPLLVLTDFAGSKKKLALAKVHDLAVLSEGCLGVLEAAEPANAKLYAQNFEQYIAWLEEKKNKEAIAHFTTLFNSTAYPNAKIAIMTHAPAVFQKLIEFVKAIKI